MDTKVETKGMKELQKDVDQFAKAAEKLSSFEKEETVLVKDSQFVTGGNQLMQGNTLSQTDEQARHEARYEATRMQKPFDESKTDSKELQRAEKEITDRYIRDFLKKLFKS